MYIRSYKVGLLCNLSGLELSGISFLLFSAMGCRVCNRESDDQTHEYCRAHAHCNEYGAARYLAEPCHTCQELFERAADLSDPDEAAYAFVALQEWITGFRKNSRNREPGQDHFVDPAERASYGQLYAVHARHPALRRRDYSLPPSGSRVSFLLLLRTVICSFLDTISLDS